MEGKCRICGGMRGNMASVFKKLVRKEFGVENYERYCRYLLYESERVNLQNPMIYEDMYHFLEGKDKQVLRFMKGRLEDTMIQGFIICKGFTTKLSAALGTMFFVLLMQPAQPFFELLLLAIGIGIVLKTHEYIANKYCYVDARLILIYKNVLDRLCPEGKHEQRT